MNTSFTIVLGATILGFQKHGLHFFSLLVPAGCPLALLPLLVLIEFISYLARHKIGISISIFLLYCLFTIDIKLLIQYVAVLGYLIVSICIFLFHNKDICLKIGTAIYIIQEIYREIITSRIFKKVCLVACILLIGAITFYILHYI